LLEFVLAVEMISNEEVVTSTKIDELAVLMDMFLMDVAEPIKAV